MADISNLVLTSCNLLTYILLCLNQGCETNNFHPKIFFLGENVGSKVKGRISKRLFQEDKARQIF